MSAGQKFACRSPIAMAEVPLGPNGIAASQRTAKEGQGLPSFRRKVSMYVVRRIMPGGAMHGRMPLLALLTLGAAFPAFADEKDKLVGTWKLVSSVSEDLSTGQPISTGERLSASLPIPQTGGS